MGPGKRIEALSMAGRFRRIQCEPIEHGKSPRVHPRSADPPSQDEFCRGVECVTGETRDYFESCGIRSAAPPGALVFKYSPGTECRAHIASCREPRHERHQSAGLKYDESHFNPRSSIGMFPRRREFSHYDKPSICFREHTMWAAHSSGAARSGWIHRLTSMEASKSAKIRTQEKL